MALEKFIHVNKRTKHLNPSVVANLSPILYEGKEYAQGGWKKAGTVVSVEAEEIVKETAKEIRPKRGRPKK